MYPKTIDVLSNGNIALFKRRLYTAVAESSVYERTAVPPSVSYYNYFYAGQKP